MYLTTKNAGTVPYTDLLVIYVARNASPPYGYVWLPGGMAQARSDFFSNTSELIPICNPSEIRSNIVPQIGQIFLLFFCDFYSPFFKKQLKLQHLYI